MDLLDRLVGPWLVRSAHFKEGWGELGWIHELGSARAAYRRGTTRTVTFGPERGGAVRVADGTFEVEGAAFPLPEGALPARVRRLRAAGREPVRAAVVMAASGEQGYAMRQSMWARLVHEGTELYFLENPLYGSRRAHGRVRWPVRTVAEQLAMNLTSVAEATALLGWLSSRRLALGITGYSMGGYMAAAAACLAGIPLAVAVLAGGLSPAPVYASGLLSRAVNINALAGGGDREEARQRLAALFAEATIRELPPPLRPDAAILVAGSGDGFVPMTEARALHELWPGSTLRLYPTGHVGLFVLYRSALRAALRDAFAALAA